MKEIVGYSASELPAALSAFESRLNVGEKARIILVSTNYLTQEEIDRFSADLLSAGFHSSPVVQEKCDNFSSVSFVLAKGSPEWQLLVPMIPTILIVGLIAFGIIKIETITKAILPVILVAGGLTIIALALIRQPATKYIESKYR